MRRNEFALSLGALRMRQLQGREHRLRHPNDRGSAIVDARGDAEFPERVVLLFGILLDGHSKARASGQHDRSLGQDHQRMRLVALRTDGPTAFAAARGTQNRIRRKSVLGHIRLHECEANRLHATDRKFGAHGRGRGERSAPDNRAFFIEQGYRGAGQFSAEGAIGALPYDDALDGRGRLEIEFPPRIFGFFGQRSDGGFLGVAVGAAVVGEFRDAVAGSAALARGRGRREVIALAENLDLRQSQHAVFAR